MRVCVSLETTDLDASRRFPKNAKENGRKNNGRKNECAYIFERASPKSPVVQSVDALPSITRSSSEEDKRGQCTEGCRVGHSGIDICTREPSFSRFFFLRSPVGGTLLAVLAVYKDQELHSLAHFEDVCEHSA